VNLLLNSHLFLQSAVDYFSLKSIWHPLSAIVLNKVFLTNHFIFGKHIFYLCPETKNSKIKTKYYFQMEIGKNINGNYEKSLDHWAEQEMIANEFVSVLSKLFYNKSIELVLYRNQLIDRSASRILYWHSYAENIIQKPLQIEITLKLAKSILHCNVGPSKLDIGLLNREWTEEYKNYIDSDDFIKHKLKDFINQKKDYGKATDVVLYGFGRIGRILARELVIQGNGKLFRIRAIVTRGNDDLEIL
jgi:glyceraldehyde 3-phosphate dehydrogenase